MILLLLAIAAVLGLSAELLKRLPVSESRMREAYRGVEQNSDWKPLVRSFAGMDWALVPAGCFAMGSSDVQLDLARGSCNQYSGGDCNYDFAAMEQPVHRVCFDQPFWIGASEVTNHQYGFSSSTGMHRIYRGPNWPRETVTWSQADQYCRRTGARLPTEAEWEYAARGPDSLVYPWGNQPSSEYLDRAGLLNPQNVFSIPADRSWVGAVGMGGNVMEWVDGWDRPYSSFGQVAAEGTSPTQLRLARGGSWASYASYLLRAAYRKPYDPDFSSSILGFRCAWDAEAAH
jgi:iron(II)-dependent oxidoreductase